MQAMNLCSTGAAVIENLVFISLHTMRMHLAPGADFRGSALGAHAPPFSVNARWLHSRGGITTKTRV